MFVCVGIFVCVCVLLNNSGEKMVREYGLRGYGKFEQLECQDAKLTLIIRNSLEFLLILS